MEQQSLHGNCNHDFYASGRFGCKLNVAHIVIVARSLLQIGFFALLIVEFVANKGLLDMLGFRIGSGLPFEI